MGNGLNVGKVYTKTIDIESNCPVNFEYEIKEVKPHPDVKVTPMRGEIFGGDYTTLTFTFSPTTFTTADCEFELKTSEFDSEPYLIRVLGSATPGDGEPLKLEEDTIKRLLTDKSLSKPNRTVLEKLPLKGTPHLSS